MLRPLLLLPCLALTGCPEFPDADLHYEGGTNGCVDRDNDNHSTCEKDCNDNDRRVFPGQVEYFEEASEGSFDFDCDGAPERELTDFANCQSAGDCKGDGWKPGDEIPACGERSAFITCRQAGANCKENNSTRTQRCR